MTTSNSIDELLDRLDRIAAALDNRRDQPGGQLQPVGRQADELLDYLAIRELMGRPPDADSRLVAASREPRPPLLVVPTIPSGATEVLVFTGQPDGGGGEREVLAQTVDLTVPHGSTTTKFSLSSAVDGKTISRLVFRTADHRPVALGPRLRAV